MKFAYEIEKWSTTAEKRIVIISKILHMLIFCLHNAFVYAIM